MGQVFAYDGVTPVVDPTAFVHETADLIDGAIVAPGCYIDPGAVLRGDFRRIRVDTGCNVQETCVLHALPGHDTVVEDDGQVGHGAVLHGWHLEENVLVGMNAVIMDEARTSRVPMVGALCFVKSGSELETCSMIVGTPARRVRTQADQEIDWKRRGTGVYQALSTRMLTGVRKVDPLATEEPDCRRVAPPAFDPFFAGRATAKHEAPEETDA